MTLTILLFDVVFIVIVGIIFSSLVIYPLVIKYLSKGRELALNKDRELPNVTIILPVLNEELHIEGKIDNTKELDYPQDKIEILVVDNGSEDRTVELALSKNVKVLYSKRGKINAIIEGVKHCDTNLVAVTDADVKLAGDSLKSMVRHVTSDVGAVSGYPVLIPGGSFFSKAKERYQRKDINMRFMEGLISSSCGLDGKFILARKEIFEGLKEEDYCDDDELTILTIKQGYRLVFDKNAKVYEKSPSNLTEEISQIERRFRIGIPTLLRSLPVLLNPKNGLFSLLIFPFRRFFPLFFPYFAVYIFVYLIVSLKSNFLYFGLIGLLFLLFKDIQYMLIQLTAATLAWIRYFSGEISSGGVWRRIDLSRSTK